MFEHSIKVPRLYKTASKYAREVKEKGASLKQLVYQKKHPNIKALYALVAETLQNLNSLDYILRECALLANEPRLDVWLARVLVTELLWGKRRLAGTSKPVRTVLGYRERFSELLPATEKRRSIKALKPRYVRVNTLVTDVESVVQRFRDEGWSFTRCVTPNDYGAFLAMAHSLSEDQFMPDAHLKDLLLFPAKTQFYQHPGYIDGHLILQDKASCLAPFLLNPASGSTVLDMCAAPGMKTSQLAALVGPAGHVYAVEKDPQRFKTLNVLLGNLAIDNVTTINKNVTQLTDADCGGVEYILVDPSCSGSGIVDRFDGGEPESVDRQRIQRLAAFQAVILRHALTAFPDARRVVYSTCSVHPQENEEVVADVLAQTGRFRLVDVRETFKDMWCNYGSAVYEGVGEKCLYARPDVDLCHGFFVAVFQRLGDGETDRVDSSVSKSEVRKFAVEESKSTKKERRKAKKGVVDEFAPLTTYDSVGDAECDPVDSSSNESKVRKCSDASGDRNAVDSSVASKSKVRKSVIVQIEEISGKKRKKSKKKALDDVVEAPKSKVRNYTTGAEVANKRKKAVGDSGDSSATLKSKVRTCTTDAEVAIDAEVDSSEAPKSEVRSHPTEVADDAIGKKRKKSKKAADDSAFRDEFDSSATLKSEVRSHTTEVAVDDIGKKRNKSKAKSADDLDILKSKVRNVATDTEQIGKKRRKSQALTEGDGNKRKHKSATNERKPVDAERNATENASLIKSEVRKHRIDTGGQIESEDAPMIKSEVRKHKIDTEGQIESEGAPMIKSEVRKHRIDARGPGGGPKHNKSKGDSAVTDDAERSEPEDMPKTKSKVKKRKIVTEVGEGRKKSNK